MFPYTAVGSINSTISLILNERDDLSAPQANSFPDPNTMFFLPLTYLKVQQQQQQQQHMQHSTNNKRIQGTNLVSYISVAALPCWLKEIKHLR